MEKTISLRNNFIFVNNDKYEVIKHNLTGQSSNIYITKDKKYVFKKVFSVLLNDISTNLDDYNIFEREVYLLQLLNKNVLWVPKLISYDIKNKIIMTEYCGERLNRKNKPLNLKSQLLKIYNELNILNIQHNDIKVDQEILILNVEVSICDWGWGSINKNHSCNINLWNGNKPYGIIEDRNILKI